MRPGQDIVSIPFCMSIFPDTLSDEARNCILPGGTRRRTSLQAQQGRVAEHDPSSAIAVPAWKRALDIVCIVLALPGVLLVMLFIAVGIKLVSPGPVLFRQERVGYRRKRFTCLKFRTMKAGADTTAHQRHLQHLIHSDAPMGKMDAVGDPRLIPLGRMLRATGLDELPQLINVLRGEMSLVGPRPCTTYELANYHPQHHARFDTLPGLTGLWQVRGKNKTTFTEMINIDIHYAKNKSLWMDLRIMAETFPTLASQVGGVLGKAASQCRNPVANHRGVGP